MSSGELYLRCQGCGSVADSLPAFDGNPALWVVEEEVCLSISMLYAFHSQGKKWLQQNTVMVIAWFCSYNIYHCICMII